LHSKASWTVPLAGWVIQDEGGNFAQVPLASELTIGPGGFVVLGTTADAGLTGGVAVDYVLSWASNLSSSSDTVIIKDKKNGGIMVDTVAWSAEAHPIEEGRSLSLSPASYDHELNDVPENWCAAPDSVLMPDGINHGTPGTPNPSCTSPTCGNGELDEGEQCDGGAGPWGCCGAETCQWMPNCCGNGECEEGESPGDCPADCGEPCEPQCVLGETGCMDEDTLWSCVSDAQDCAMVMEEDCEQDELCVDGACLDPMPDVVEPIPDIVEQPQDVTTQDLYVEGWTGDQATEATSPDLQQYDNPTGGPETSPGAELVGEEMEAGAASMADPATDAIEPGKGASKKSGGCVMAAGPDQCSVTLLLLALLLVIVVSRKFHRID